ncbi:diguanylate cyclase/phosphodiesterase (GGDEF & EAL domains) with PAS/PAC sensor(s) [hydrothermal vent metagenome]|uniref:Diguanylate cyclase/phosphodiesterase (GGDEF & EAL domains) with PAS/PAC sensor(S) n=1 Tax=hydrothermal vent metagenome TaxID=652676 RepID=A0A1W1CU23_9ZZZZ
MYDMWIGIGIFVVIVLVVWLLLMRSKKRLMETAKELKFLKSQREYYDEAMIIFSLEHRIIFANEAAKNIFALDKENQTYTIGKKVKLRVNEGMPTDFFETIEKLNIEEEKSFKLKNVTLIVSGKEKKVNIFLDKSYAKTQKTITCVIDLDREENEDMLQTNTKEGTVDFLTGLPTQFVALSEINTLVIESKKKLETFGVFLLGIDHFKEIQTTLGLGHSNQILKNLAKYFMEHSKKNMRIFRMDFDRFLFIVPGVEKEESVRKVAKELIIAAGTVYKESNDIRLSSSIGIALYPQNGENAIKLVDNSYIALNQAQTEGDANIKLFDSHYHIIREDESIMKEDIRKGLLKNEFLLYYQPIFNLSGEEIMGAEALLRWKHPKHGLISADKFLNVAESSGLIVELGEYVFNEAILQCKRCNIGAREDFKITINLSLKEMQVDKLLPRLEILFDKHQVEKHMINLDICEEVAIENIDKMSSDFKLFKDFGLSLSLDHFGAGLSSFKYLNMLPIDVLKIDRSLIFDLTSNIQHQTMVKVIIEMAHTLGYEVVAEGVEISQEVAILKSLKCDYAQGYLYSRPLPSKEFESLLN